MSETLDGIDWELADLMMAFETDDPSWIGKLEEARKVKEARRCRK